MEGIGPPAQTRGQSRREEGVGSQDGREARGGKNRNSGFARQSPVVPWDWEPVTGMGSALATGLGAVGVGETTELAAAGRAKPGARDQYPAST